MEEPAYVAAETGDTMVASSLGVIRRIRLFASLDDDEAARIADLLEPRDAAPGQRIFSEGDAGDALYVITSGAVRVFVTSATGDDMTLSHLGPGEVFGELALLDGERRSASVEAREATTLLRLSRRSFTRALRTGPGLTESVLASLAALVRRLTDQTADVVFHDVHERVARILLRLIEEHRPDGVDVVLDRRATEHHIATVIGRSARSVSDILHSFEHLGCISIHDSAIAVRDIDKLSNQVREGVSWAELTEKVYHDPLTGLPNRVLFNERLASALATATGVGHHVGVIYVDLDGFKGINDSFGHAAGDAVLREIAERFNEWVRKPDTVARLGGDEFGVLLERISGVDAAIAVAQRIIMGVQEPLAGIDPNASVGASLGISIFGDANRVVADDLLEQADAAMYAAKLSGKGRYIIHRAAGVTTPVNPSPRPDGTAYAARHRRRSDGAQPR